MSSLRVLMHAWRAYRRNVRDVKHEPETPYLRYLISGAPVCLHVGASDGRHSYAMHQVAPAARIWAFEPSGFGFRVLQKTTALHKLGNRITPVHAAVADAPGELLLVTPRKKSGRMGRAFAFVTASKPSGGARPDVDDRGMQTEKVAVVSLDDFCAANNINRVDFIRMDIEGAEFKALKGASKLIDRDHPSVLIEIHPQMLKERFGSSAADVVKLFLSRGYRMFAIKDDALEECYDVIPGLPWKDYFFIHPSRASDLPSGEFQTLMQQVEHNRRAAGM